MVGIRWKLLAAAVAAGVSLAAAGSANAALNAYLPPNYTFPSGFQGFKLASHGGDFNPGVLVGFNPQPDPPGDNTMIGLGNPGDPELNNPANGGAFNFLIALLDLGDGSVIPGNPIEPPNSDGFTGFRTFVGGHDISVGLQFGGSPIESFSWGSFNPQPDPPGDWIGGSVGFAGDPFMRLRMSVDGTPETFTLAGTPEPGTWALMLLGFGAAGAALRARRRAAAAA
jgi:hypothetical protein